VAFSIQALHDPPGAPYRSDGGEQAQRLKSEGKRNIWVLLSAKAPRIPAFKPVARLIWPFFVALTRGASPKQVVN
jgi:hypothetical protein